MQDCAAATLDLVFPAGQPGQEAACPLLHRRSASQAQVPGRLFPRPSPDGFICVEVWAVARQINQPQPQTRSPQIFPHRLLSRAAVLLPGRTAHPLGAPPHTASATALALGSPVRSCPGPIARLATPCLTPAAAIGVPTSPLPTSQPKILQHLPPDRPASFSRCVLSLSEWLNTTTAGHLPTPKVQNLPGQSLLDIPYPLLRHLYHPVRWIRA